MSLGNVQGAGTEGSDILTTSAPDFKSLFSPTSPDPDPTQGRDDGLREPCQLDTRQSSPNALTSGLPP